METRGIEQLLEMPKEDLVDLIRVLWTGQGMPEDYAPEGFSYESQYKDALYSGYIEKDMEMIAVVPTLSDIRIDGTNIYLNGDIVELVPQYKAIQLFVKGYKITGIIKAEILARMIVDMTSTKVGDYLGWAKYLVQYKSHTLVINTKGAIAGIKLLKNDHVAKIMYERKYPKRPIVYWADADQDEKIFGSKEISIPHAVDNLAEEIEEAFGVITRGYKYSETKTMILEWLEERYEEQEYDDVDA